MLQSKLSQRLYAIAILSAVVGYFLYIMVPWLNNNLWSDEFYTLKWFSLVPFKTVVTDYHSTNHILYDLFNYSYLKMLGINSLAYILEHPWIVRLPLLLLALVSISLIYQTAKLINGRLAGIAAVALLATDIPFQNYCMQIRGYGFTAFFDLLLVYSCLLYIKKGRMSALILMGLSGFAAMYSVLSNLYCLVGILTFWGAEYLFRFIKGKSVVINYWKPTTAVLVGLGIALLCYSPVFKDAFCNHYVSRKSPAFHISNVNDATFVYAEIIHGREPLYVLFLLSVLIYFTPIVAGSKRLSETWRIVFWQFIAPIVIVAGMGQHPPARIFIHLCVFLDLLIAVNMVYVAKMLLPKRATEISVVLLSVYLICACQKEKDDIAIMMSPDVIHPVIHQDLRADYYLYYYYPLNISHYLAKQDTKSCPVILYKAAYMHCYLETLKVPFYPADSLDRFLDSKGKVFLSTVYPVEIDSGFMAQHHCSAKEILPRTFDHLFELQRR